MSVLDEICAAKRLHIQKKIGETPLEKIKEAAFAAAPARGFLKALRESSAPSIIAEIKKASPSQGIIRTDFDPVAIAKIYEDSGAACISVLTDEPYFHGKDEYLLQVKKATSLPLLRKDFMLDPYQIYESRALGADCILLIMAALTDEEARNLHDLAVSLGMDVLVEIHDAQELQRALRLKPAMIGVNNRDLKSLKVDTQTSIALAPLMPADVFKISESGISDLETIGKLKTHGYQGFLIGESLMRMDDIALGLKNFRQGN